MDNRIAAVIAAADAILDRDGTADPLLDELDRAISALAEVS